MLNAAPAHTSLQALFACLGTVLIVNETAGVLD
jgi:hypothetical protein